MARTPLSAVGNLLETHRPHDLVLQCPSCGRSTLEYRCARDWMRWDCIFSFVCGYFMWVPREH